ncbi:hypothetical protein CASFOL_006477 [Castilleja foliolosa]|uniref:Uncharacterized protein n=1 Tax=Castilleja foliolosa TaxID=1961234 RepID=A0ABD3EAJ0_9LAMI
MNGVNKFADLVGATLGPQGRNVVPGSKYSCAPKIREAELEDELKNIGANLVRQAAVKANDLIGDGARWSSRGEGALPRGAVNRRRGAVNSSVESAGLTYGYY